MMYVLDPGSIHENDDKGSPMHSEHCHTQPLGFEITIGEFILTRDKGDSNTNGHLIKEMCVPKLRTKRQLPDSATAPNSEETNYTRSEMRRPARAASS